MRQSMRKKEKWTGPRQVPRTQLPKMLTKKKNIRFLGFARSRPKTENVSDFDKQFDSGRYIWAGSARESVCRGEERGVVIENWLLQELLIAFSVGGLARRYAGDGGYLRATASSADIRFRFHLECVCVCALVCFCAVVRLCVIVCVF